MNPFPSCNVIHATKGGAMKRLIILYLFLLAACGTSPEAVQPTPQTPTPVAPTAVPTLVPLDKINLVGILTHTGTLPKGLINGQASATVPEGSKEAIGNDAINTAA